MVFDLAEGDSPESAPDLPDELYNVTGMCFGS